MGDAATLAVVPESFLEKLTNYYTTDSHISKKIQGNITAFRQDRHRLARGGANRKSAYQL